MRQSIKPQNLRGPRGKIGRKPMGPSLNRVYESSGPDGKVRGTAQQIIEKYESLARDAATSGDRVASENYHQHAEHYARILLAASGAYEDQPRRPPEFGEAGEEAAEAEGLEEGAYEDSDPRDSRPPRFEPQQQQDRPRQHNGNGNGNGAGSGEPRRFENNRGRDRNNDRRFDRDRPPRGEYGQRDRAGDRGGDRPQNADFAPRNGDRDRNAERDRAGDRGGDRN